METSGRIKRICVISPGYPTAQSPMFPFVDQLVCAFTLLGVDCTVISPQSLTKGILHKDYRRPTYWEKKVNGKTVRIYQPKIITFSNTRFGILPLYDVIFEKGVIRAFKRIKKYNFDVIYGHFWNCGLIAAKIGKEFKVPAFVACGESEIPIDDFKRNIEYKTYLNGVICVSSKTLAESVSLGLCKEQDAIVLPNAIDNELFFKMNRVEARRRLNIQEDLFIVSFVGAFSERKGSLRLSKAIEKLQGVGSIFVGLGPDEPTCDNIVFKGQVSHSKVPEYLAASDVFVLPTKNEGCCNAIIEAMACGLPIISSDCVFNYDVLDNSNSILVDPEDIEMIANAINKLKNDDELRNRLSYGALETAKKLTIRSRAEKVLEYLESRL